MTHLIVATRTAHPGLLVAGRQARLEVIAYIEGQKEHAVQHGEALLFSRLVAGLMPTAAEAVGDQGNKRVRQHTLKFIIVPAPPATRQVVRVKEVMPSPDSGWRAGFNKQPVDVESRMLAQVQTEMDRFQLSVMRMDDGSVCLMTLKARGENDIITPMTGLVYDNPGALETFLSHAGNKARASLAK
jgi:hypothetical protein